jgi:hypothetical protein
MASVTLQSASQSFTVLGAPLAAGAAAVRAGFVAGYGGFADRVQNNAIHGGLEWKFWG